MAFDQVTLKKLNSDGLSGAVWSFLLLRKVLVVDRYEEVSRKTKRHSLTVVRSYSRLRLRSASLNASEVPLSPEIMAEAKEAFIAMIQQQLTVGLESPY